MSFEAYKIAVSISLVEHVSAGLASLSTHFKRADMDAAALQKRLDSIGKMTLAGGLLVGAGAFGLKALQGPLDEAKKYQNEMARLQAQGVGDAALTQADKYAKAQTVIGASHRDTLKMVAEANSVLRDMHHAEAVTPLLLRMKFGIESVMNAGGHGSGHGEKAERMFMDALKVTELRGALNDPVSGKFSEERFSNALNFMTRAYTASNGLVKPTEYLNMIKTGGIAAKSLNDQSFYFGLMHMAQEQGGSRTGTGLMSAFQNMYMGRTTQQVAEEMNKVGLLDKDKLHYGKTGHLAKIDPGSLKDAELFRTNQFGYMNTIMLPLLRSQGVKDGEEMKMAIAKLFSNRTGGSQWVTMYQERANIQKHINAAGNALGIDGLAQVGGKTLAGKEIQYEKRMADLKLVLGEKILPMAIRGLEMLNSVIGRITRIAEQHPTLTKFAVVALATVAALAVLGGSLLLAKAAFSGMGLLFGGMLSAGAVGMVSTAFVGLGAALAALAAGFAVGSVLNKGIDALLSKVRGKETSLGSSIYDWTHSEGAQVGGDTKSAGFGEHGGAAFGNPNIRHRAAQDVHVTVTNNVNERGITSMVTRNQAKDLSRPLTGPRTFDGSVSPQGTW